MESEAILISRMFSVAASCLVSEGIKVKCKKCGRETKFYTEIYPGLCAECGVEQLEKDRELSESKSSTFVK